jgi:branched-chain amino acid transport system ATP-binding protein
LLDEVLAGLTATEVAAALDMIRHLHQRYRLTLIVIEHVMRALMKLCSRIVVLHHGEKLAEGTPNDIVVDQRVISAYFGKRAS